MPSNRIPRGGATPRARSILAAAVALLAAASLLAGCGGGGSSTSSTGAATDPAPTPSAEESADAKILNTILSRQEAAVGAYTATIGHLGPRSARMASYFRAQEQEHVDALLKAMRGLARSPAEPKDEEIAPPEAKSETDWLVFLYEVESKTIDDELSAVAALEASWPRSLLASTVGDQAQHLSLLRRTLGAGPLASIPSAFEDGTFPPPVG